MDRTPDQQKSPVIRCEAGSTDDLPTQVNINPGAIGCAEVASAASDQPTKYRNVDQVQSTATAPREPVRLSPRSPGGSRESA